MPLSYFFMQKDNNTCLLQIKNSTHKIKRQLIIVKD